MLSVELLHGIGEALAEHSLDARFIRLAEHEFHDESLVPFLRLKYGVDGLLINVYRDTPCELTLLLRRSGMPAVFFGIQNRHVNLVAPASVLAGRDAVRHLYALGHRQIVFMESEAESPDQVLYRRGYQRMMRKLCLLEHVFPYRESKSGLRLQTLVDWLQVTPRPTAVVAATPSSAMLLQEAALRAGLSIPRDLSLITFCGFDECRVPRSVARLERPDWQMGQAAVQLLLEQVRGGRFHPAAWSLPYRFDSGDTIAPPL